MKLRWTSFWLLAMAGLALVVGQIVGGISSVGEWLSAAFGLVAYFTLGGLIILRRDGHLTGWLLTLLGLAVILADGMARQAWADPATVAWLDNWAWTAVFALFAALTLTFPLGRGPLGDTFWARVGRIFMAALPFLTVVAALTGAPEVTGGAEYPLRILPSALAYPVQFAVVMILIGGTVSLFVKRHRALGVERAQFTWVVYALGVFATTLVLTIAYVFGSIALGYGDPGDSAWSGVFVVMLLFPLSFGVAVMRYRLFEIDRIVSRTVAYTLLAVLLAAGFFGLVTALAVIMPGTGSWRVAGSTLAVAALFNPLRRRVQLLVDRRFNRSHYDAERIADGFISANRSQTDPDLIVAGWLDVVTRTLQPALAGVWVRQPDRQTPRV